MDMLKLYEYVRKVSIGIPMEGGVIGRKGSIEPDFFKNHGYVSEEHCEIFTKRDKWFVRHLGDSYCTRINGVMAYKGCPVKVKDGDIIQIADLWFKVSIHEEEECKVIERIQYKVICPVCGKEYIVDDPSARINQCVTPSCFADAFDRHKIKRVRAVKVFTQESIVTEKKI